MAKTYPVSIQHKGGTPTRYTPEFQSEQQYAAGWKATLTHAPKTSTVTCCCPGRGEKRLSIRHYDSDTLGLARYPMTGPEHANDCRFYFPDAVKSGLSSYHHGVVEEAASGLVKIRLQITLKKQAQSEEPASPKATRSRNARQSQPAMRLLGLLHFLWEQAGLNQWYPYLAGKRNQHVVNGRLREAANQITASRMRLDSVLLLPEGNPQGPWMASNRRIVVQATAKQTRLLAILPLAHYTAERDAQMETRLKVSGFQGIPILDMPKGLWQQIRSSFPRAISAWERHERVIAIAELELKRDARFAKVVDVALMPISDNWIPFDSLFELRIADKLTAEQRSFIKPLRFDAASDLVFPDFILRDTGADTPLEVFGRNDEAYEARKEAKTAYYQEHFGAGNWWCWNAAADPDGQSIPAFPAAAGGSR